MFVSELVSISQKTISKTQRIFPLKTDSSTTLLGSVRDTGTSNIDTIELCRQLKYWQCLRQDLERARLLCELVRKREKLKVEYLKARERCLKVELKPFEASLRKVLELVSAKDTNEIFSEPVDLEEVSLIVNFVVLLQILS